MCVCVWAGGAGPWGVGWGSFPVCQALTKRAVPTEKSDETGHDDDDDSVS